MAVGIIIGLGVAVLVLGGCCYSLKRGREAFSQFCDRLMKIFLAFVILVILSLIGAFIWESVKRRGKDESPGRPYQIQAVATDHEECSKIGNDTLNSNGSAVDAAIASVFCLGVINMHSSGVGGGGVMLVYNRKLKKAKVIDFRETAPETTTSDMFPPNEIGEDMSERGLCPFFL